MICKFVSFKKASRSLFEVGHCIECVYYYLKCFVIIFIVRCLAPGIKIKWTVFLKIIFIGNNSKKPTNSWSAKMRSYVQYLHRPNPNSYAYTLGNLLYTYIQFVKLYTNVIWEDFTKTPPRSQILIKKIRLKNLFQDTTTSKLFQHYN